MQSTTIEIVGMHCNGCVRSVGNALKRVAGVKNVLVKLQDNTAQIEYEESETTVDEFRKAIQESGYDVKQ